MGLLQSPNILFLNKTWAAEAIKAGAVSGITEADLVDGLTLTAAQMEALLTYFRDNDMNGNGKADDERPLSFVYNNWQGNQCDLYGMFGLNDNLEHRVVVDNKITLGQLIVTELHGFFQDQLSGRLLYGAAVVEHL